MEDIRAAFVTDQNADSQEEEAFLKYLESFDQDWFQIIPMSQEEAREEVTLEDVQVFDEDPTAPAEAPAPGETASPAQQPAPSTDAGAPAEGPAPQQASQAPAEEGTDLPFEG